MTMSLQAAAQAMREAMRETVKRHSLWYLVQGALMVLGGVLALVYPIVSSGLLPAAERKARQRSPTRQRRSAGARNAVRVERLSNLCPAPHR